MAQIAQLFAGYPSVGRPVIDRTGLTGKYDWHLEWTPTFLNSPTGDRQFVANPAAESGPNFFTALSEQARLKLQPERAPVDVIVIDRAERPTEE